MDQPTVDIIKNQPGFISSILEKIFYAHPLKIFISFTIILTLLFFFFFRNISLMSILAVFVFFFFKKILVPFACFFLKFFFVFLITVSCHFLCIEKKNCKKISDQIFLYALKINFII